MDDKLEQAEAANKVLKNELADKAHLLNAAQRKLNEVKATGQPSPQGLLKQGSTNLQRRMSTDNMPGDDVQQLLAKRTEALDKEKESNLLLLRYSSATHSGQLGALMPSKTGCSWAACDLQSHAVADTLVWMVHIPACMTNCHVHQKGRGTLTCMAQLVANRSAWLNQTCLYSRSWLQH